VCALQSELRATELRVEWNCRIGVAPGDGALAGATGGYGGTETEDPSLALRAGLSPVAERAQKIRP
jgi:hypothetical protein